MNGRDTREFAPAKVNLYLHVVGRRDDGYHLLDSLVVFPAVGDLVSLSPSSDAGLSLRIGGPFGAAIAGDADNLVRRAARALAASAGIDARAALTLEKNLPVASGIGGGSSDAAATLRLLARAWSAKIPDGLAFSLGADVPVCLDPKPRRMAGVGEILSEAPPMPACGMVLINPGVAVSTPAVFRAREGRFSAPAIFPAAWRDAAALADWLAGQGNDLEAPARTLCPAVGDVLAALRSAPDCLLARMSGSGATCFAIFETPARASRAAALLAGAGWWAWGGALAKNSGDDAGKFQGLPTPPGPA